MMKGKKTDGAGILRTVYTVHAVTWIGKYGAVYGVGRRLPRVVVADCVYLSTLPEISPTYILRRLVGVRCSVFGGRKSVADGSPTQR